MYSHALHRVTERLLVVTVSSTASVVLALPLPLGPRAVSVGTNRFLKTVRAGIGSLTEDLRLECWRSAAAAWSARRRSHQAALM